MSAQTIGQVWTAVIGTQPGPPHEVVLTTGAVALVVVGWTRVWLLVGGVATIVHEGGHAVVALLSGHRLTGIKLHSDTSGVTFSRGRQTGFGAVAISAAGYTAPPALGLAFAVLLTIGHITFLLWLSILALLAMLVVIRNVYGVVSIIGTGAAIFAISAFTPSDVQAAFAYLFTWFLLLAGVRGVVGLQQARHRTGGRGSDADHLARMTGVPGFAWVLVFALAALAALGFGARWLLLA